MGFDDPLFYRDDEQLMQESMDWTSPALQGITMESLKDKGYARLNLPSHAEYAPHAQGNLHPIPPCG